MATVAIVANQFGTVSSSETPETSTEAVVSVPKSLGRKPSAVDQTVFFANPTGRNRVELNPNQEKIKKWLEENVQDTTWIIQIEKDEESREFRAFGITNDDLEGLHDYLTVNSELLKSLSSETQTTFTFKKTQKVWKHTWTREHINAWVNKTSENKATLQIGNLTTSSEELKKLFDYLKDNANLFNNLTDASPEKKKTILLEKVEGQWKRSKTEIENWLKSEREGNEKFTIKIQTSIEDQDLDKVDEGNLVGLLNYLKGEKDKLLEFVTDGSKTISLIFKDGWNVVLGEETIRNWIDNAFSGISLNLWDGGKEKGLTSLNVDNLKDLFDYLKDKKDSFKNALGGESEKTIILEKYDGKWMPIKDAITELLKKISWYVHKSKIRIKKGESETLIENAKNDELTGLYEHLKDKEDNSNYENCFSKSLVLEKENNNSGSWKHSCGN